MRRPQPPRFEIRDRIFARSAIAPLVERRRNIGSRYRPEPRSAFRRLRMMENASNDAATIQDAVIVFVAEAEIFLGRRQDEICHALRNANLVARARLLKGNWPARGKTSYGPVGRLI